MEVTSILTVSQIEICQKTVDADVSYSSHCKKTASSSLQLRRSSLRVSTSRLEYSIRVSHGFYDTVRQ